MNKKNIKKSYKKFKQFEKNKFVYNYVDSFVIDNDNIKKYYKINHMAYKLFHSHRGFMHFRISKNNSHKWGDIYYQPNTIGNYIKDGSVVVELGPGNGSNLFYLAQKFKSANFTAVDLSMLKYNKKKYSNVNFFCQDYTDLSFIKDESVDVIYAIETIVHTPKKAKLFSEISRVLKKGGVVIIYDYALTKPLDDYPDYVKRGIQVVSTCGVSPVFESNNCWKKLFEDVNLTELSTTNYSKEILFDLKRLQILSNMVMWNKPLMYFIFSLFPKLFCGNIIIGWVAYDGFNENIVNYNEWIYKK